MARAKRLQPKPQTLRELFLKSGNLCAFPGCASLMINADGVFIGQLCHIEAAEENGERFNPSMTNEQRRAFSNLMLMCYPHHQITNDVQKYTVSKMREMKRDHERRFADPSQRILLTLIDQTTLDRPTTVQNLQALERILQLNLADEDLLEYVDELNRYLDRLRLVPVELRRFVGKVSERAYRMEKTGVVQHGSSATAILVSDVASAFRLSPRRIVELGNQLDGYAVGHIDQIDTALGSKPAIAIRFLHGGWPLWPDLMAFCEMTSTAVEVFSVDLDFRRLDLPMAVPAA